MATIPTIGSVNPLASTNFTDPKEVSRTAGGAAQSLFGQGLELNKEALTALGPLITKFMKIVGGDPAATSEAAMPQVSQILQAYDASRQSTQFAPRGGGQASAMGSSRSQEAGDIAKVKASVKTEAQGSLQQIFGQLLGAGTSEMEYASSDLANLLQSAIAEKGQTQNLWASIGAGIGKIITSLPFFGGGK